MTTSSSPQPPTGKSLVDQTWKQGKSVSYAIPAADFIDPQHEALTYTATLDDGTALPFWLNFNPKTRAFTGIPPAGTGFAVTVTAMNTDGLSVSETFNVTLIDAPVVHSAGAVRPQTWRAGQAVDITLPDGTFTDPQGQTLTYSARQSSGAALPTWLHVDKTTGELTGTVSPLVSNMTIVEVATDTSGLSASFSFSVIGLRPPVLSHHVNNQTVLQGKTLHLSLATEFTDPLHQALTYKVTEQNGAPLPSWLTYDAANHILSGTAPSSPGQYAIAVTATNTNGLSLSDHFLVTAIAAPMLNHQTANQTFLAGQSDSFALASDTFIDPNGQRLTYTASQGSGAALPGWLHFNPATETFYGTPKVGNLTLASIEALTPAEWAKQGLKPLTLEVYAHDTSGLVGHETFTLSFTNVPF